MLTRFAPSPTGFLHLGHVVNAIHVWGLGHSLGARVLLRIEDHDAQRSRPEYERALLEDLDWLGFEPDMFPTAAFRAGACESRQSNRQPIYAETARDLIARGLVYACDCSRRSLRSSGPGGDAVEPPYPGTCRDRSLPLVDGLAWRLRLTSGVEDFDDVLRGHQSQTPASQSGDVVIRDRLGNWTYQFVVSVDDFRQEIDLIIRGADLLESTGRQIQIARLIGRQAPAAFAHHPLVMKSPAQKLSKSDGDTGIGDMRRRGWTPGRLIGHAARLVRLVADERDVSASQVPELFRRPAAFS